MSTEPLSHRIFHPADLPLFSFRRGDAKVEHPEARQHSDAGARTAEQNEKARLASWLDQYLPAHADDEFHPAWSDLSSWSRSGAKRIFDCACVLLSLPVLLPLILVVAAAVRLTSRGPVFFLQERIGWHGLVFTILKFRTMVDVADAAHHPIAILDGRQLTPVGPFLRRWKLDELPQLANVLLGHMSLVGPRPKMREHVVSDPPCRPGITGLATIVFAREERIPAFVAKEHLDDYFRLVVLPAKRQLDAAYMARATFLSDLRLLVNSVLRRWETQALDEFILATALSRDEEPTPAAAGGTARPKMRSELASTLHRQAEAEEIPAG